jgi:hypothetical protein
MKFKCINDLYCLAGHFRKDKIYYGNEINNGNIVIKHDCGLKAEFTGYHSRNNIYEHYTRYFEIVE